MSPSSLDLLLIIETHICQSVTDSLLRSVTLLRYNMCHRPHAHGLGSLIIHNIQLTIIDSPLFVSFENIVIATVA